MEKSFSKILFCVRRLLKSDVSSKIIFFCIAFWKFGIQYWVVFLKSIFNCMGVNINNGNGGDVTPDINMTPFIDVMLVLLVIFISSVTAMVGGLDVKLPTSKMATAKSATDESVTVVILKNGHLLINDKMSNFSDFDAMLGLKDAGQKKYLIKADKSAEYYRVINVLDLIAKNQISNVSLVTEVEG